MLLFKANSIDYIIPFDDTYEELVLKGRLEILLGLTENEKINKHWLEVGSSVCDFTLYIRCLEDQIEKTNEPQPIKVQGRLSFGKNMDSKGSGIVYIEFIKYNKLLAGINRPITSLHIPLGELGSSYIKNESDAFECNIQMEVSQISINRDIVS
jgi:hypothetical protein